ncbi:MAG: glycerophosphoryl diester phosphodiesterase [Micavibrio sp.]|nr:glycerophosphoryl diester phosphodiesterase [Micavibrio sp.]
MTKSIFKIPRIIGHRGAAAYAPENTIVGIHTAADMGVDWVELDVKLTKDNIPILFHDDTLDRTTNGSGNVADLTLKEVRDLDAGHWFGDSFFDLRIPTLEQAVDALIERDMGVNFEIKPCAGREKETAEVVLDYLSQIWDDHSKILISSFSHVSLEIAADMANDWARSFCIGGGDALPENVAELARYLEVKALSIDGNTTTPEQLLGLQDLDLALLAYTINDPDLARELQAMGITGFFTDEPDTIMDGIFMVH